MSDTPEGLNEVWEAQQALNAAIQRLPDDIVVEISTISIATIGQQPREIAEVTAYRKTTFR